MRFTISGTEATHLAMQVARPISAGIPGGTLDQLAICPPNDLNAVQLALERGGRCWM